VILGITATPVLARAIAGRRPIRSTTSDMKSESRRSNDHFPTSRHSSGWRCLPWAGHSRLHPERTEGCSGNRRETGARREQLSKRCIVLLHRILGEASECHPTKPERLPQRRLTAPARAAHRGARLLAQPDEYLLEMTQACGLACRHCRAEAISTPHPEELTHAESMDLLQQIASFGDPLPHLILTGGDPLRRADLYELIDEAHRLG